MGVAMGVTRHPLLRESGDCAVLPAGSELWQQAPGALNARGRPATLQPSFEYPATEWTGLGSRKIHPDLHGLWKVPKHSNRDGSHDCAVGRRLLDPALNWRIDVNSVAVITRAYFGRAVYG
jgi:hypothetical protein